MQVCLDKLKQCFFAAFKAEAYVLSLVTRVMIFAIAALSLDLLIGYGALISFGHAAFIGLGAYAVGILGAHGIHDALISLPVALTVSALFAWATGIVSCSIHSFMKLERHLS